MPFYEYECQNCKFYTELLQKVSDPPLKKCPSCGKSTMKKLVSAPVFRLKGGGWYETDFKTDKDNKRNLADADKGETKADDKKEAKADAKAESKGETKGESKGETKAESKPEAKAESKPAAKPVRKKTVVKPKAKKKR